MVRRLFDAIPTSAATPLLVAAAAIGAVGAALVFVATVYGNWIPALGAAGAFVLAGVAWHGADHAIHHTDR